MSLKLLNHAPPETTGKKKLFLVAGILFLASMIPAIVFDDLRFLFIPFAAIIFFAGLAKPQQLFFLLLASIPFSTEYVFPSGLGTDLPDEPFMWLTSYVFLAVCLPAAIPYFKKVLSHPVMLLLITWLCWMAVTVVFSRDPFLSLKFIIAKSWYVLAFVGAALFLFKDKKNISRVGVILVMSMFAVVSIILYQHSQTGFRFATVNEAVEPFFRNHVNYGAMLVCLLPVSMALYIQSKSSFKKNIFLFISFLFLVALYFSFSRGAWLALVVGLLAWWLIKRRMLLISFIVTAALILTLFFWLKNDDRYLQFAPDYKTTIFHEDFTSHFVATYKLKDISTEERFYRWIAGIRMVKDNWLMGTGPNTFYPTYKEYAVPAYKTWVSDNPERSTVHNYYLLTLIEQGLPGLLFFVLLCAAIIYYIEKGYRKGSKDSQLILLVTGSVFTMILTLNFLSDLIETDKVGSLFFICVAIILSHEVKVSPSHSTHPSAHSQIN